MTIRHLAAAAALALSAGSAGATTISMSVFTTEAHAAFLATMGPAIVEDFENLGPKGNREDGLSTRVGTFRSVGGTGSGASVTDPPGGSSGNFAGNDGSRLAIREGTVHGRRSTTALRTGDPARGRFLDSNDTLGIAWTVDIGSAFTRILLTLADATDSGATLRIAVNGVSRSFDGLVGSNGRRDGNIQILLIDFGAPVTGAAILFETFRGNRPMLNDGFSIDDIAVSAAQPVPVPLPAPALLLLAGLGGLAALRLRRARG